MRELLAEVQLRNRYRVYADGSRLYLEEYNGRTMYSREVDAENVRRLGRALNGQVVTVNQILQLIETKRLDGVRWHTWGGYKRRFEIQDYLITLVAIGRASVRKQSREYVYEIRPAAGSADQ